MKIRRPLTALALLLAAACGDPAGPGEDIAEVRITPEGATTSVGLSVQFSAQARNADGQTVSGQTTTWASSNTSVATIDAAGLATALSVGVTSITATIGGQSDSHPLTVQPNQCTNRIDVVLAVGEFQSYPGGECLLLPAGQSGDRYRVVVARPTLIEDSTDVPDVTLEIAPLLTTAAAPVAVPPQLSSAPRAVASIPEGDRLDGTRFMRDARVRQATRAFHHELRARERALGLDLLEALPDRPSLAPQLTSHPDPPATLDLFLGLACTGGTTSTAELIGFNDDLAIYQEAGQAAANRISQSASSSMLSYYTNHSKTMIEDYFGPPSDTDGNGRVYIVTTPEIPEGAAAAVFSGDFLPTSSCANSNEGEIIYFGEDVIHELDDAEPGYLALGVIAHEMKHVVSLYNGVQRGAFHPTWMEEGRAEIAQVMSSRVAWAATGGPAVGARISGNDIISFAQNQGGGEPTPEMWAIVGEAADLVVALSTQPNSLTTNPVGSHQFHTFYAASYHLHRYLGDVYGNAATPFADASLFSTLADPGTAAGAGGLSVVTGGMSFDQIFEEVVVALSLHGTAASAQSAIDDFTTWDWVTVTNIFASPPVAAPDGIYPWPVTHTGGDPGTPGAVYANASYSGTIGPSGIRVHEFVSNGQGQGAQIQVTGAGLSGRIIVTRIN